MENNQMKNASMSLVIVALLLAVTPALAETPVEPAVSADTPAVTPDDANAVPPTGAPNDCKNTGASNPCTPDPTKNTPGAEAKH
jgi:hypothetical protein